MPCNSDYMHPTQTEKNSRKVAEHLIFVYEQLDFPERPDLVEVANHIYGSKTRLDEMVAELCGIIRDMTPDQLDRIVYNGRDPQSRKLADWWEEHERADREREQAERESKLTELDDLNRRVAELEAELFGNKG